MTPLAEELRPAPDPSAVARAVAHLPHLLILESAEYHPDRGRYSFVAADPVRWYLPGSEGDTFARRMAAPAECLRAFRAETLPDLPPFQGGLAGVFGYELNGSIERVPAARRNEFELPAFALGVYDWVVAFDHSRGQAWLVVHGLGSDPGRRMRQVLDWIRAGPRPLADVPAAPRLPASALVRQHPLPGREGVTSNFDRPGFLRAVARAVEYVHAGDCFQVNVAQRLLTPASDHPLELYRRCRERNPAPFAGYLDAGDFQVASASPERFLRVRDGEVRTRPIKGTRPRGTDEASDRAAAVELAASEKDRAENVMIVDLLRNDLGRVCEFGSVRVPVVCEVESFRFVHHLVSEVRGRLRPGLSPLDLLEAAFPGGSVTGAPKVRAMEIIAELEPTARGPYCGSLGYIGFDGTSDMNILIRTFTQSRGWVQFPVGGGIVADSEPASEYQETLDKAEGLLRSLR